MARSEIKFEFYSPLAEMMASFIKEKQACGYKYERDSQELCRFDRFLCNCSLKTAELPRQLVDQWTAKRVHERPGTQILRIIRVRQLALYLSRLGIEAYIPAAKRTTLNRMRYSPYIFTRAELKRLLQAADSLPQDHRSPMRHLIMPEVFRLLCCCGMRISEVLNLTVADMDLAAGLLVVREGKFNKDRLLPLAPSMTERLTVYSSFFIERDSSAFLFPSPRGRSYSKETVYGLFRQLLRECGIPHGGRGSGPRLHDIRHAFAVHRLESWYREGADLGAKLPLLSAYMGHKNLVSTQWYLHITPEIFPDVNLRLEEYAGHVIPRRRDK